MSRGNFAKWCVLGMTSFACTATHEHDNAIGRSSARATSASVVISQIYGGGGNAGATLRQDFIELHNVSTVDVSLANFSLQYASATGTGTFGANDAQLTPLRAVTLAPGQYFLVQEAPGSGGTVDVAADLVDSTPINLSATAGKVALVNTTASLGCNGGSTPCSPAALASLVDLVGYGSANFFEGPAPAAAPSNKTAVLRDGAGCADSDDNGADFAVGAPLPRGTTTSARVCAPAPDSGIVADGGHVVLDGGPHADAARGDAAPSARIHDLQGRSHTSPLAGQAVAAVPGVVTAVGSNGFYFEDTIPDDDPSTSEGVFVFTSSAPRVAVGDAVAVDGRVAEFRPACNSGCSASDSAFANLTTTELVSPSIAIESHGNALPPPVVIGRAGRLPPGANIHDDLGGASIESVPFEPSLNGADFWESLEAMRIELDDAISTGITASFSGGSRELAVIEGADDAASLRTPRGGIVVGQGDFNPERIILGNALAPALPDANVGDRFPGAIVGVVDYSFGDYKLYFTDPLPALASGGIAREVSTLPASHAGDIDVSSFNVENLSPNDPPSKFAALADIVVSRLGAPDILAVEEVQDNDGATDDGVVDASQTYALLTAAITAAGGPAYDHREVTPANDQDGGQPGGNIRVGLLFRTDRGLAFVDHPGATFDTPDTVNTMNGSPELAFSPGRIDPANPAWNASRKPLAAEFTYAGQKLFVIANHFVSKLGDQPLYGRFQLPQQSSEAQRVQQATAVAGFVGSIRAVDPAAKIVVMGDLNDFQFSQSVSVLKNAGLTTLVETLPEAERYTYVYEGNSEVLDHILVSPGLLPSVEGFDVVHVNAEFVDQVSDHDPSVARIDLVPLATNEQGVRPEFECVTRNGHAFTARFGYTNPNASTVTVLLGAQNRFLPAPANRGQPTVFAPGHHAAAFTVAMDRPALVWQLGKRLAIALGTPLLACR